MNIGGVCITAMFSLSGCSARSDPKDALRAIEAHRFAPGSLYPRCLLGALNRYYKRYGDAGKYLRRASESGGSRDCGCGYVCRR